METIDAMEGVRLKSVNDQSISEMTECTNSEPAYPSSTSSSTIASWVTLGDAANFSVL